jgi:EmrB/QacA subfamily drug resistance transporter
VLQGVGSALVQANSVAIIVAAVGDRRRGRAIGVQAAAQAVGLSAGPALGGLLISTLGWRWVFFLNVPVGLMGTLLGLLILPQTRRDGAAGRFDWDGAILLAPALTALMIALNEVASWGLASPALIFCLLLAAGFLAGFIWRELKAESPLLDLSLFRDLSFSAGNLAGLLAFGTLFGVFFLLPFAFERIYRLSSLEAGLRLTVIPIMIGCLAPLSGRLSDRLGPRALTVGGMVAILAGLLLLLAALDGSPDMLWLVTLALAVFGIGQGLFTAPNNSAILASTPKGETGEAGGLLNLMRSLGTSTGIATAAAVLSWQLATLPGHSIGTLHAPRADLIAAAHAVIAVFAGFALVAAAASLIRGRG